MTTVKRQTCRVQCAHIEMSWECVLPSIQAAECRAPFSVMNLEFLSFFVQIHIHIQYCWSITFDVGDWFQPIVSNISTDITWFYAKRIFHFGRIVHRSFTHTHFPCFSTHFKDFGHIFVFKWFWKCLQNGEIAKLPRCSVWLLSKIEFSTQQKVAAKRRTFMQNRLLIQAMKHFPNDWSLLFRQFHAEANNSRAIFFRVRVFAIK